MTTNSTTKKPAAPAAEPSADTDLVAQPAVGSRPPAVPNVVRPPISPFESPIPITLVHHFEIDGTAYPPGADLLVAPEYAERLRAQGYAQLR
ncbi:hypothetical protein [Streptomyces hydrogenans]|uniref:hypothetical protein n=1 Tax=Streptomyces hydrogenans TaxID=1873719 RepID=UPI003803EE4D